MRRTAAATAETGSVMTLVIFVCIFLAIVMVALTTTTRNGFQDSRKRSDRVAALPMLQSAITKYEYALRSRLVKEHDGYVVSERVMEELRDVGGAPGEVFRGSIVDPPIPGPASTHVTMREPLEDGLYGFWHVFRVDAPNPLDPDSDGNLVVYFRGWTADASGRQRSEPRLQRVEFRPGRFTDAQLIVDGPIRFADGASINGPVHSNGLRDDAGLVAISAAGSVSCGAGATFTTARGSVQGLAGCPAARTNTGDYVNLLRAEDTFESIREDCALRIATVRCFEAGMPGTQGYLVNLLGAVADIRTYTLDSNRYPVPGRFVARVAIGGMQPRALLFSDDVVVRGTTTGRLTIASRMPVVDARNSGFGQEAGASNIYIGGNVAHAGVGSTLGLVAQGSILLEAVAANGGSPRTPCASRLDAAMVAQTGTIAIDPRYTIATHQPGYTSCGSIRVFGSIAAHRAPLLFWSWSLPAGGYTHAGFADREFVWNEQLRVNPPPYFPLTETWQASRVSAANLDCLLDRAATREACE